MSAKWYFQLMGDVIGPLTAPELNQRARDGQIQADTFVRKGEDGAWVSADRVKGLLDSDPNSNKPAAHSAFGEPSTMVPASDSKANTACRQCGRELTALNRSYGENICASCSRKNREVFSKDFLKRVSTVVADTNIYWPVGCASAAFASGVSYALNSGDGLLRANVVGFGSACVIFISMFPVFFYFAFVRGEILKTHIQNLVKGDSKARIHALKCIESEGFVASVGNAAQRDERVIPAVVGALVEDKNPEVRSEAQATLVRLGSRTDNRSVFHRVIRDELKLHDEYDASAVNEVLQRIGPDPLEMD